EGKVLNARSPMKPRVLVDKPATDALRAAVIAGVAAKWPELVVVPVVAAVAPMHTPLVEAVAQVAPEGKGMMVRRVQLEMRGALPSHVLREFAASVPKAQMEAMVVWATAAAVVVEEATMSSTAA